MNLVKDYGEILKVYFYEKGILYHYTNNEWIVYL